MPNDLLTSVEVAKLIGKARYTVAQYVRDGKLKPAIKLPGGTGAYLFSPEEVERFQRDELEAAS